MLLLSYHHQVACHCHGKQSYFSPPWNLQQHASISVLAPIHAMTIGCQNFSLIIFLGLSIHNSFQLSLHGPVFLFSLCGQKVMPVWNCGRNHMPDYMYMEYRSRVCQIEIISLVCAAYYQVPLSDTHWSSKRESHLSIQITFIWKILCSVAHIGPSVLILSALLL